MISDQKKQMAMDCFEMLSNSLGQLEKQAKGFWDLDGRYPGIGFDKQAIEIEKKLTEELKIGK